MSITTQTQLLLPGQTHAAEGPHDHTGMYVMHHAFRRDLARLASAVRDTPLDDTATWRLLSTRYARFASALHHHHTAEDDIYWPALRRAATTRGTAADLAAITENSEEHAEMDPRLDRCADAFGAMADRPCAEHRDALATRLADLAALLLEHMGHEEQRVLPVVQRVMTEEEFAASEKEIAKSYALRDSAFLVAWAMDGLDEAARERMFASAGSAYRILHALVRRRFERHESRTFRHAAPARLA